MFSKPCSPSSSEDFRVAVPKYFRYICIEGHMYLAFRMQEEEYIKRKEIFEKYRVDQNLIDLACDDVMILHCLPAHRGEEITEDALESSNSYVFEQAENRLHIQQALLAVQLGGL